MRKNEPDATKRVAGPIPFYDADGQLKSGLAFNTAESEVYVYRSATNDWVAAANDAYEINGAGIYLVQMSQSETNHDTLVGVKLVKAGYADQFWFSPVDSTNVDGLAGLMMRRALIDQCVYSAKKTLTSARVRVFASEAALAAATAGNANDADGEIERYTWSAVDPGTGLASSWKLTQVLP